MEVKPNDVFVARTCAASIGQYHLTITKSIDLWPTRNSVAFQ